MSTEQLEIIHSNRFWRVLIYTVLIVGTLVYLLSVFVMVVTSFKSLAEIRQGNMLALPVDATLASWVDAWNTACIGLTCEGIKIFFLNSIQMVVPAVLISVGLGALNGYVLTKWRFRGHQWIFGMMLFGCFIPFQAVLVPMAQVLGKIGIANSVTGLVFVHVVYGIGFTTLFFRNYYEAYPSELIKAAMIDGAGFFKTFFRILLPSSGPIIVVSIIWQFTNIWNDFLFGASFTSGDSLPMTVALNNLVNSSTGVKEYNVHMAAAMIAAIPTVIVYVLAGKYFVRGLMAGSVKG